MENPLGIAGASGRCSTPLAGCGWMLHARVGRRSPRWPALEAALPPRARRRARCSSSGSRSRPRSLASRSSPCRRATSSTCRGINEVRQRRPRDSARSPSSRSPPALRDPAPPALRHRRRDQPRAGLRRADRDARRRRTSALRAAGRARGRPLGLRGGGLDAGGGGAVPPGAGARSRARSTAASTAAATTRRARSRRSARGCATSSTSRRWAPTCAASCRTRCSPRTCRCG